MERQLHLDRRETIGGPGSGADPAGSPGPYATPAGGTLQSMRSWESVASEALQECEGTSDAQGELRRRRQRSAQ